MAGVLSLVGVLAGAWELLAPVSLQLSLGLWQGRRFCLPCVAYFELVQPWLGEGPLEDSWPPRFANEVGAVFAGALGPPTLSAALGGIVAALALLSAVTGFCTGCWLYRLGARLRVRPGAPQHIDLSDLGVTSGPGTGSFVVESHPLYSDCHEQECRLRATGEQAVLIDVFRRPDLARRYRVASVSLAVRVDASGPRPRAPGGLSVHYRLKGEPEDVTVAGTAAAPAPPRGGCSSPQGGRSRVPSPA